MTTKSCARKRKFRAPRHTESLLTCDFVVGLCARIFLSFLCRNLVNSVSDLSKIAGIAGGPENSRAHLSLTRWKSGLPAQVPQFVFGRRTIDCSGLYVRGALEWNFCWRYVTGLMKEKSVFGTSNFSIYPPLCEFLIFGALLKFEWLLKCTSRFTYLKGKYLR